MKKLITFTLALFTAFTATLAEESTLFQGETSHGGFGGPVLKISSVNGDVAVFAGGRGGWIINHSLTLGMGGYALLNDVKLDNQPDSLEHLNFAYGGLELGMVLMSDNLIHLTSYVLIGAGAVNQGEDFPGGDWERYDEESGEYRWNSEYTDRVFVIEPTIATEINMTKFIRLEVGAGYRQVWGIDKLTAISNDDLSSFTGNMTVKFGWF